MNDSIEQKTIFCGLNFSAQDCDNLLDKVELYLHDLNCKAVPACRLHLTLMYLGKINMDQCNALVTKLDHELTSTRPFMLSYNKIIALPLKHSQAVALLVTPTEPILELHQLIKNCAQEIGIAIKENYFLPHISIARSTKSTDGMPSIAINPSTIKVTNIACCESTPNNKEAAYSSIKSWRL
jgi:2'-5' RNA ligase